jgi:hypothetical protein
VHVGFLGIAARAAKECLVERGGDCGFRWAWKVEESYVEVMLYRVMILMDGILQSGP